MIRLFRRVGFIFTIILVATLFTVKSLAYLPIPKLDIKSLDSPLTIEAKHDKDFKGNFKIRISEPGVRECSSWGGGLLNITGDKEFSKFHFVLSENGYEVRSNVKKAKSVGVDFSTFVIREAKGKFYFSIRVRDGLYYVIQGKMKNKNIMDSTIEAYIDWKHNTLNVTANNFTGKVKVIKDGELFKRTVAKKSLKNVNNFICDYSPETKTLKVNEEKAPCTKGCKSIN